MVVELLVIVTTIRLDTSVANIFVIIINKNTCGEQDRSLDDDRAVQCCDT